MKLQCLVSILVRNPFRSYVTIHEPRHEEGERSDVVVSASEREVGVSIPTSAVCVHEQDTFTPQKYW